MKIKSKGFLTLLIIILTSGCAQEKFQIFILKNEDSTFYMDYLKPNIYNNLLLVKNKEYLIKSIEILINLMDLIKENLSNIDTENYIFKEPKLDINGKIELTDIHFEIDIENQFSLASYYQNLTRQFIKTLEKMDITYTYPDKL